MSLTPPPLRSGSVPAQDFSHGGHGGSEAAPPTPPSKSAFPVSCVRHGWVNSRALGLLLVGLLFGLSVATAACAHRRTPAVSNAPTAPLVAQVAPDPPKTVGAPGAVQCHDVRTLRLDLEGRGVHDVVLWQECAGARSEYPTHRLQLDGPSIPTRVLYSNEEQAGIERLAKIEGERFTAAGEQLLYVVQSYGSGNIWSWKVVDWRKGALREWTEPDDVATLNRLHLRAGEGIHHQVDLGPTVQGRTLTFGYLIHEGNECEACASGGVAKFELRATDGAFVVSRVWRE
jgi:hypothetical protein